MLTEDKNKVMRFCASAVTDSSACFALLQTQLCNSPLFFEMVHNKVSYSFTQEELCDMVNNKQYKEANELRSGCRIAYR